MLAFPSTDSFFYDERVQRKLNDKLRKHQRIEDMLRKEMEKLRKDQEEIPPF